MALIVIFFLLLVSTSSSSKESTSEGTKTPQSRSYDSYGGGSNGYNPYNPYPNSNSQNPYPPPPNPNPYPPNPNPPNPNPYPYPYPNPYPPNPTEPPSPLQMQPVAFSMVRAMKNNQQCLNLQTCFLSFQQELTNLHATIYRAYGAFQAPSPGIYQFNVMVTPNGTVDTTIALRKNNDDVLLLNGSRVQSPVTAAIVLQLNAQDAVYLVIENGDIVDNRSPLGALNSFSGFQIAPLPMESTNNGGGSTNGMPGANGQPGSQVMFSSNGLNGANSMPSFLLNGNRIGARHKDDDQ